MLLGPSAREKVRSEATVRMEGVAFDATHGLKHRTRLVLRELASIPAKRIRLVKHSVERVRESVALR